MRYARLYNDYEYLKDPKTGKGVSRLMLKSEEGKPYAPRYFYGTKIPYNGTPQTCPMFREKPKVIRNDKGVIIDYQGAKDDMPLSDEWWEYIEQLNGARGKKFLLSRPSGLLNTNDKWDALAFGGNMVEVLRVGTHAVQIKTLTLKSPPSFAKVNPGNNRTLLHRFTVVTKDNKIVNPAEGILVYVPLITKSGTAWIPRNRVEL